MRSRKHAASQLWRPPLNFIWDISRLLFDLNGSGLRLFDFRQRQREHAVFQLGCDLHLVNFA